MHGDTGVVRDEGLSITSVMDLMESGLLGKGHHLYVDHFYSSPYLFQKLFSNNNVAPFAKIGGIPQNNTEQPSVGRNEADMEKRTPTGQVEGHQGGDGLPYLSQS